MALTDGAREHLASGRYDPAFGARPLKRLIQREVLDALARKLLAGEIREGDEVEVAAEDGELLVRSRRGA
jgi:ATP-dependent Clp protease ATP-binding subunit ClpB